MAFLLLEEENGLLVAGVIVDFFGGSDELIIDGNFAFSCVECSAFLFVAVV